MIQYIYFVKCPNCEDEPFDFFDEAKEFALGCLSNKPIITQVEVNRNDFGECTDSADLGTIWSWEDLMSDIPVESGLSTFTKDDLKTYDPDCDPEFDCLDNSLDCVPDNFRKPIPEGMTIEQLVEEMEENEDMVECTWCEELFDKYDCRKEVDLGWLCDRCQAAIMSRGEPLTFRENNYWDFLDESIDDSLTEALGYDCPKLREAENNKPGIAKFKIMWQLMKDQDIQAYIDGNSPVDATFKNLNLIDSVKTSYGHVVDIELANNGELMLVMLEDNKTYSLRHALRIASPATVKFSNTRTVLLALKDAAEVAEKSLSTTQVRNLRVRNALSQLTPEIADEFKNAITDIVFSIPDHNAYSADDLLNIDEEASEEIAERAAEKINKIHDDFNDLPFVRANLTDMESAGMIEYRKLPETEKAAWVLSSWGAVGKIYFNCQIAELSQEARKIIEKAKLSETKVNLTARSVDCYRLATELIRYFGNDPLFFNK